MAESVPIPNQATAWTPSMMEEAVGVLPPAGAHQLEGGCRRGLPNPKHRRDHGFLPFFRFGLSLPSGDFLRGLLHFYGINIHHLNPNSILQIAIFIHLCEAYYNIPSHFAFFHYLYQLKPQPDKRNPMVVGEVATRPGPTGSGIF